MGKTRLQLAQRLRRECKMNGTGPTSTVGQSGEYELLIDWIDDTYERIQSSSETFSFLRKSFSFSISSGISEYTTTAATLTDHANWITDDVRCRLTSAAVSDEQEIYYVEWEEFRRTYLFGSHQTQTGRPVQFTIKPDDSIQFWPIPDANYTITGEYYRSPYDWATATLPDDEEPIFPARWHMAIVWGALYYYGANYAEIDRWTHGQNEFERLMRELVFDQAPRIRWGGSLA